MKSLAVSGYSSMDHPVILEGLIRGDETTKISHRGRSAWPRIGGCPAYVAIAAAAAGQIARPVTWVGSDSLGYEYIESVRGRGADVSAIEKVPAKSSPVAILAYQPDGSCACLYDPAFGGEEELSSRQIRALRKASHLCITAGPPHLTRSIAGCRSSGSRLYWVLKNDPHCFTPELRIDLAKSADVIFCSRSEIGLIDAVDAGTTVVETSGSGPIRLHRRGHVDLLEVRPLSVRDTTGAGDAFAGGFIAAEMLGVENPIDAAEAGTVAARKMLAARMELEP